MVTWLILDKNTIAKQPYGQVLGLLSSYCAGSQAYLRTFLNVLDVWSRAEINNIKNNEDIFTFVTTT